MSLYTTSVTAPLPLLNIPEGLTIGVCTDASLLAQMGTTTMQDVTNRLVAGHIAFIARMQGQPAAFGWMAREKATIGELNHELVLPTGNRYLWNFRTMEAYRGLGIYPALLQHIIRYEKDAADRFWIVHAPENSSSLKGIQKAGFQYVGKLYTSTEGIPSVEATASADACRSLLEQMGLKLSEQEPASCWNCSSPYLKKRQPGCCCAPAAIPCTDNRQLALAA